MSLWIFLVKDSLLLFCSKENPIVISRYVFRGFCFLSNRFCAFKVINYYFSVQVNYYSFTSNESPKEGTSKKKMMDAHL